MRGRQEPLWLALLGGVLLYSPLHAAEGPLVLYSEKPLYARLALAPEGQQVLNLVLDEKLGTGRGYDRAAWDRNFDGRFTADEVLTAELRDLGYLQQWLLSGPPLPGKVLGQWPEAQVTLSLLSTVGDQPQVSLALRIQMEQPGANWEYQLSGLLKTGESLAAAPLTSFWPLKVAITAVPDPQRQGAIGLGMSYRAGDFRLSCRGGAEAEIVHVVMKDEQGAVVHEDRAHLGRFAFG